VEGTLEPAVDASKWGGRFLWPNNQPWPVCSDSHTEEEDEYDEEPEHFDGDPDAPCTAVPVIQLRKDDVGPLVVTFVVYLKVRGRAATDDPQQAFPEGMDVFQLLWCPRRIHWSEQRECKLMAFWWSESEVKAINARLPSGYGSSSVHSAMLGHHLPIS
jgi:hypothetical protein